MEKVFKGSLGFTGRGSALIVSGIFSIISMGYSIKYIVEKNVENVTFSIDESPFLSVPICLFGFGILYRLCAFENYSIHFLDKSLVLKNYFIEKKQEFKYEDIDEIIIKGDLIPLAQKVIGVHMQVNMKQGKNTTANSGFRLKNFSQEEIKSIFKTFNNVGISYQQQPKPKLKPDFIR